MKSPPGLYTRLRHGDWEVFMTDLYDEWWTQLPFIEEARRRGGPILITGLGLGLIVEDILGKPGAPADTQLIVLEQSADVISLVAPHLLARYPRGLAIVQGDAFTWAPPAGAHYSMVWHDIWPDPQDPKCAAEIAQLEARFAPFTDWQQSWTLPAA